MLWKTDSGEQNAKTNRLGQLSRYTILDFWAGPRGGCQPQMSSERHSNTAPHLYVWCVIVAGAAAISDSLYQLTVSPIPNQWLILAALTLLSGSFTVKVPKVASSISVSETFVVISVLVFGPSAATLTVALEALVISLWILRDFREVRRVFFNMGASAFSIWTASQLFYFLLGQPTISGLSVVSFEFLFALIIFISCYFLLNSMTVAIAVAFNSSTPTLTIWKENFAWLSLNYFGGASVAVLLVRYHQGHHHYRGRSHSSISLNYISNVQGSNGACRRRKPSSFPAQSPALVDN